MEKVTWKIRRVLLVDRQACKNYALVLVLCTFKNSKFVYKNKFSRYLINFVALFSTSLTVDS